jgi:hypothetical protein
VDNIPVSSVPPPAEELAALRRRAYGPDADIEADPLAQARLEELEREYAARGRGAPDGAPIDRDAASEDATPASTQAGPPDAEVPGRMRRALPIIAIGASVVAVIAVGALGFERLNRPQPAARLEALADVPRGTAFPLVDPEDLRTWGVIEPVFVSYGEYGALDAWSMSGSPGRQCIVVSVGGEVAGIHCTTPGIDTFVDILSLNSWMPEAPEGGSIPLESTIRFVLRDDVVDVYVGRIDKTPD